MKWIDFIRANAMFLGAVTIVAMMIGILSFAQTASSQTVPCITVIADQAEIDAAAEGAHRPTAHLVGVKADALLDLIGRPDVEGVVTDVVMWPNLYWDEVTFLVVYVDGCRRKHANLPTELMLDALKQIGVTPFIAPPTLQGEEA